jgi:hypothetical protein
VRISNTPMSSPREAAHAASGFRIYAMTDSATRQRWYLRPVWISLAALLVTVAATAVTVSHYAWQRVATLRWIESTDGYYEFGSPPAWVPRQLVEYWPEWALPMEEIKLLDVRGNALDRLKIFREVRILDLSRTDVTDAGLVPLAHCRSLQKLNLAGTVVGDEGLKALAGLPLETLDLSETGVTDAGMGTISGCRSLQVLRLKGVSVGDAGLAKLKGLRLQILRLSGTRVTDAGLAELGPLPYMEWLDLDETMVGDPGLAVIETWAHVQILGLAKTRITDAGLAHLYKLPLLSLDLSGTAITDAGLKNLPARSGWGRIELGGTAVTASAAEKLGKALGLKVSEAPEGQLPLTPDPAAAHFGLLMQLIEANIEEDARDP